MLEEGLQRIFRCRLLLPVWAGWYSSATWWKRSLGGRSSLGSQLLFFKLNGFVLLLFSFFWVSYLVAEAPDRATWRWCGMLALVWSGSKASRSTRGKFSSTSGQREINSTVVWERSGELTPEAQKQWTGEFLFLYSAQWHQRQIPENPTLTSWHLYLLQLLITAFILYHHTCSTRVCGWPWWRCGLYSVLPLVVDGRRFEEAAASFCEGGLTCCAFHVAAVNCVMFLSTLNCEPCLWEMCCISSAASSRGNEAELQSACARKVNFLTLGTQFQI